MRMRTQNDGALHQTRMLHRVILLGERHTRRTIAAYVERYHRDQNHQGRRAPQASAALTPEITENLGREWVPAAPQTGTTSVFAASRPLMLCPIQNFLTGSFK